jgi:cyclopropane-fatty-acyl-phospholipid synthase
MMDNTLYIARKSSLYENIVLRRLARMDKGRLELELPDGSCLTIGDGLDAVRARIRICDEFTCGVSFTATSVLAKPM